MRIVGEWFRCDDGIVRPTLRLYAHGQNGERQRDRFLVDSGSDRTVLSAFFLRRMRMQGDLPPAGFGLSGIGGSSASVIVRMPLELVDADG